MQVSKSIYMANSTYHLGELSGRKRIRHMPYIAHKMSSCEIQLNAKPLSFPNRPVRTSFFVYVLGCAIKLSTPSSSVPFFLIFFFSGTVKSFKLLQKTEERVLAYPVMPDLVRAEKNILEVQLAVVLAIAGRVLMCIVERNVADGAPTIKFTRSYMLICGLIFE